MGGTAPAQDAQRIVAALRTVVLGQEAATLEVLVCLLARGHILLEGVPGTAKTLLVRTLALALDVQFGRIQFTPAHGNPRILVSTRPDLRGPGPGG